MEPKRVSLSTTTLISMGLLILFRELQEIFPKNESDLLKYECEILSRYLPERGHETLEKQLFQSGSAASFWKGEEDRYIQRRDQAVELCLDRFKEAHANHIKHAVLLEIQNSLEKSRPRAKIPIYIQDPAYLDIDEKAAESLGMTVCKCTPDQREK